MNWEVKQNTFEKTKKERKEAQDENPVYDTKLSAQDDNSVNATDITNNNNEDSR